MISFSHNELLAPWNTKSVWENEIEALRKTIIVLSEEPRGKEHLIRRRKEKK